MCTIAADPRGYAHLIVENFHSATGLVKESENLILDVKQLFLVRGNASHKIVVTLF